MLKLKYHTLIVGIGFLMACNYEQGYEICKEKGLVQAEVELVGCAQGVVIGSQVESELRHRATTFKKIKTPPETLVGKVFKKCERDFGARWLTQSPSAKSVTWKCMKESGELEDSQLQNLSQLDPQSSLSFRLDSALNTCEHACSVGGCRYLQEQGLFAGECGAKIYELGVDKLLKEDKGG